MWLYTKAAIIAVLAILCVFGGFKVSGWWYEAQLVKAARAELQAEQQRRIEAVAAKNTAQTERDLARTELAELRLKAKEAEIAQTVKTAKQAIVKYVKANPVCDLPDEPASQLQKLREGGDPVP
jgi:hypothetical protein